MTQQQDREGQGHHQAPHPSIFPYKKRKDKENYLVMTIRCRINYISILTVPNIILSYHETRFEIITSILPDCQFDRPSEI